MDPQRADHRPRHPGVGRRRRRLCSVTMLRRGPLRRRLHALAARAGARAGGVPARRGGARAQPRPGALRGRAARGASPTCSTHPELVHDEEIWIAFTEDIVRGMGGDADGARACAVEIVRRWEIHANFDLYDDAAARARRAPRPRAPDRADLERAARPRGVRAPPRASTSTSPSARRATAGRSRTRRSSRPRSRRSGSPPAETVMVGDSYADDIEGARALGMRAILLDRDGLLSRRARPDRRPRRAAGRARALAPELARGPTSARQAAVCAPSAASSSAGERKRRTRPPPRPASRPGRRRRPRRRRARATPRAAAPRTPPRARARAPPGRRRTAARRARAGRSARRPREELRLERAERQRGARRRSGRRR